MRRLQGEGCEVLTATRAEADLRRQAAVDAWMERNRPQAVRAGGRHRRRHPRQRHPGRPNSSTTT
ncbi:MAG: hypothetical protein WDM92_00335 [Caulobacteraceae bacterium]